MSSTSHTIRNVFDTNAPWCLQCGKPYYYVGDVPKGGWAKGFEPYCTCGSASDVVTPAQTGWVCPNCGRGVNPNTQVCPCKDNVNTIGM